jgi:hypothetical protein
MNKIKQNKTAMCTGLAAMLTLSTLSMAAQGSYAASMAKPFSAAAPVPVAVPAPANAAPAELPDPPAPPRQQVKDDLFAGTEKFAAGASDVSDVNIGPDTLGMVSGKHGGDIAKKMNFMLVRSYTYPKAGMYNMADVDSYRQKLRTGNWNCFVHTYEQKSGESTDICNRALPNGEGNEMVIMTVEPKELTFIHMSGKGSLADLSKLGSLGSLGGLSQPTPPTPPAPPAPKP